MITIPKVVLEISKRVLKGLNSFLIFLHDHVMLCINPRLKAFVYIVVFQTKISTNVKPIQALFMFIRIQISIILTLFEIFYGGQQNIL